MRAHPNQFLSRFVSIPERLKTLPLDFLAERITGYNCHNDVNVFDGEGTKQNIYAQESRSESTQSRIFWSRFGALFSSLTARPLLSCIIKQKRRKLQREAPGVLS